MRAPAGRLVFLFLIAFVVAAPAPAEVVPSLQVFFPTDFTSMEYQKKAYAAVVANWKLKRPVPEVGKKAVVIAKVGRDGQVTETIMHMESGTKNFDEASRAAVAAAKFPPLPRAYRRSAIEVHWHFQMTRK